jgi:hypothetical protein
VEFRSSCCGRLTVRRRRGTTAPGCASDQAAGWQLIEVTWDGATVTRYRGGVSRATAALAGTISLNRFSLGVDIHDLGYVTGDIALYGFMTSVPSAGQLADFRAWVTSYYGIAMG